MKLILLPFNSKSNRTFSHAESQNIEKPDKQGSSTGRDRGSPGRACRSCSTPQRAVSFHVKSCME